VARDAEALDAFLRFLGSMGTPPDRVALLTEANTQYGRSLAPGGDNRVRAAGGAARPRVVPFPLHIAHLRAKSDEASGQGSQAADAAGLNGGQSLSGLVLGAPTASDDVPPPHAKNPQAHADVLLTGALQQLANAHVRYVGILASDVQDTVVLAREVRKHVPNATLFALNHELLYLHAEANSALTGTRVTTAG
jgi:hypothetical protein